MFSFVIIQNYDNRRATVLGTRIVEVILVVAVNKISTRNAYFCAH